MPSEARRTTSPGVNSTVASSYSLLRMRPRGTSRRTGCTHPSSPPFLPNRLGMIGSYSFNPQLNPQKLLHCCIHPHGGQSAQRSESHPLRTHRTVHPRTPPETLAWPPSLNIPLHLSP